MFPAFQERLRQLFRRAKFDGGAVSRSTPVVEVVQTWNNPNEAFVAAKFNITNSASAAASMLMDLQVNGSSAFTVDKSANLYVTGARWKVYSMAYGAAKCFFASGQGPLDTQGVSVQGSSGYYWGPYGVADGSAQLGLVNSSAGLLELNSGTAGVYRDFKLRNLIGTGNLATGTVAKTADYTATTSDGTIEVDASGAARTITLFAASGNAGKIIVVKKTDSSANAVTVDGNASETIDGATTISLASQYSTAILQVNAAGTGWNKLGGV